MSLSVHPVSLQTLRKEFRPTLRLALPLIFAEIGWMSMGVVDTIMVGRLPNSAVAIGATGLGQSLYNSVAIFGGGLLLGMDTFVARAHGRDDIRDARHSLVNGFFLALALTPILMLLVSFWPMLMRRFGVSSELIQPMQPFLQALNWGTLPLLCYFALRRYLQAVHVVQTVATGALRGSGDTRTPMLANLVAYWFIGLPFGYLLCFRFGLGALGIWIGLCIGLMIIGSALLFAWHKRLRSKVSLR